MKAIILAAGKGDRIKKLTGARPKSLLPLGDTTLLGRSLRIFWEQGLRDIIVATGYRRDEIADYVRKEWNGNVEFVYNPQYDSTNVLYSFWLALSYLGKDDFFFLHADTVFSEEVFSRLRSYSAAESFVFAVDRHACEEEEMKVQITDGYVSLVTKQMPSQDALGEFLGIARIGGKHRLALRRHAERLFEAGEFSAFFELAVQRMIEEDGLKVAVCDVTGLPWCEVDFPEDYRAAQKMFG